MFCSDEAAPHPRPVLGLMRKEERAEALGSKLICYCFLGKKKRKRDTEGGGIR